MGASQSQHKATDIDSYQEEQTKPVPIARKLPYNYVNIIKEADSRPSNLILTDNIYFNFILIEEFCEHLHHGVFLNGKRKKYWIEKESGYNCFMLYARDLTIRGSDNTNCWKWSNIIEASSSDGDIFVEVAELLDPGYLDVEGIFNTSNLSPNTMYEIIFVVKMLNNPSYGWETPVNFSLTLPNGETKKHKETLLEKPKGQWIELQVGEFYTSLDEMREMKFSMIEQEPTYRRGFIIKVLWCIWRARNEAIFQGNSHSVAEIGVTIKAVVWAWISCDRDGIKMREDIRFADLLRGWSYLMQEQW